MENTYSEPYRLFFPLGALYGLWGVSLWIAFGLGLTTHYPGVLHATVMMGGFLGAFAFGFLTTAVPRLTRSFPIRRSELLFILLPLMGLPVIAAVGDVQLVYAGLSLSFCGIIAFLLTRFMRRTNRPPDSFVFVGVGIICGTAGSFIGALAPQNTALALLGKTLLFYGFIPALVLGVGARLIPVLLGRSTMAELATGQMHARRNLSFFSVAAVVFLLSFFVEIWVATTAGRALRFAVVLWIAAIHWKIWRLPLIRSIVSWLVWAASWFCVLGFGGQLAFPSSSIHFVHLVFVAGLGLMTLMIATRVVLAHGGFNLILESRLKSLWAVGALLAAATFTRVAAGLLPGSSYQSQLYFAAALWIAGLGAWIASVGRRLAFPLMTPDHHRSC